MTYNIGHNNNNNNNRVCVGCGVQKNHEPALKAFAEEIYYKSQEFGVYDVRTSGAFYNLSKVFVALVLHST